MAIDTLKTGDRVFIEDRGHRNSDPTKLLSGTVASVGRVYIGVQIDDWRNVHQFHMGSGEEKTNYSSRRTLYLSEQAWRDKQEHGELHTRVRRAFDMYSRQPVTLDQLRRITAILDEPTPTNAREAK